MPPEVHKTILALKYNGNVSQYGWVIDDKVVECSYNGCHSQVLSYPTGTLQAAWSFGPNIPVIRLEYIFDESVSPWRTLIPSLGVTVEEVAAGVPFVFNDLSLDANKIVNMMFMIRWPSEQINSYALWERLLLERVHPGVADLLTALVATRDQHGKPYDPDKLRYTNTQLMHSNFISLYLSNEYAENFVNGRLAGGNGNPFDKTKTVGCANDYESSTKSRGYKPVVGAFGKFEAISYPDQLKGRRGEYMAFLEETYGGLKDFNHLVEIGHHETKRFKLGNWAPGERFAQAGILTPPGGVELSPEAVKKLERYRSGRSHWRYVQTSSTDPEHAHGF